MSTNLSACERDTSAERQYLGHGLILGLRSWACTCTCRRVCVSLCVCRGINPAEFTCMHKRVIHLVDVTHIRVR